MPAVRMPASDGATVEASGAEASEAAAVSPDELPVGPAVPGAEVLVPPPVPVPPLEPPPKLEVGSPEVLPVAAESPVAPAEVPPLDDFPPVSDPDALAEVFDVPALELHPSADTMIKPSQAFRMMSLLPSPRAATVPPRNP